MKPLITLWFFVLGSTVLLSGFFYLAENYPHIIGNFYFLAGIALGAYLIMVFMKWWSYKNKKKNLSKD
ncbi:hypothetical protein MNBD_NITROSPIRAE01-1268 [hydrothermal vent metagenome]|uniref:Uncharacterized protein n=1 Tax=hydrothermal vent metagenome TaxID=652676 RepID=A0A3B1CG27_9ZZZZ|nr:hypothetical protein [Candidatus Manganitrophaceae bacterium]